MKRFHFTRSILLAALFFALVFMVGFSDTHAESKTEAKIVFPWWNGDIYTIDGKNMPQLIASGTNAYLTLWSPDKTQILYESSGSLYKINANGTGITSLATSVSNLNTTPAWSPTGNKIAFTSDRNNEDLEIYVMNADGSNQVRLTNQAGRDSFPSWSADGTKIVFSSERDGGKYQLYTMNADGSNPIRITNLPGSNYKPVWSPNGNAIAFYRVDVNASCPRIFRINPDGSNLTSVTNEICELSRIMWLPDSNRILYQQYADIVAVSLDGAIQNNFTTLPNYGVPINFFDLYMPLSSGTGLRGQYFDNADVTTGLKFFRINPTINFNWANASPDTAIAVDTFSIRWTGKVEPLYSETYTFYVTQTDGARLWVNGQQLVNDWVNHVTAVEHSGTIMLTAGVKYDIKLEYYDNTAAASVKLEWSSPSQARQVIPASQLYAPEGQLTFTGTTSGNADVFIRNPDGTGEINLSNHATQDNYSAWSPDGTKLAFVSTRDGNEEIYMVNADGTGLRRLTNHASSDVQPAWSADGTRIAFTSYRTTGGRLYSMSVTGTGIPPVTRLTNLAYPESNPMWSPNGTKVIYEANVTNNIEIYVVNYTGTVQTPQRITARSGIDAAPFFAPDGLRIAFRAPDPVSGIDQIWIANTTSPYQLRKVTSLGANYFESWSPDGTKILFMSTRTGNAEIFTMDAATQATEGQNQTNLTNNAANESYAVWSPDARQIAFVRSGDVYLMNRDGSNQRQFTNTPTRTEIELVWWQTKQAR